MPPGSHSLPESRRLWAQRCLALGLGLTLKLGPNASASAISQNIRLTVDGRRRSCRLYQPATCRPGFAWPLVLAFHGFLQPNRMFARYTDLQSAADRHGFILALPQGDGWGIFRSFNAGMRDDANDPDDVHFTAALLANIQSQYPIDPARIYAIGMSNGGTFAQTLAQQCPGVLAGVVSVSGAAASPINPLTTPTPIMLVHGTADPISPWTGPSSRTPKFIRFQDVNQTVQQWRTINGSAATPAQLTLYDQPGDTTHVVEHLWHAPPAIVETVLLQVQNGGHRWPGPQRGHYFPMTGQHSYDIPLNDLAWSFLSRQSRRTP